MKTFRLLLIGLCLATSVTGCRALECEDVTCGEGEYCIFEHADVGREHDATCEPLPETCKEDASCECLEEEEVFHECDDSGSQVNVSVYGG